MDSLITAAARALATGDPLGALKRVALRDDAPALALRGIAMAQLGDLVRAKALLKSAARAYGPKEAVARARCVVAEAEIALVSRDLSWPAKALDAARATLEAHGDRVNAAHARNLEIRRLLLIGRLDEAERTIAELDPTPLPPASRTAHELAVAGIAIRRLQTKAARAALAPAEHAAREADIPALTAEVESASLVMKTIAARLIARGEERPLLLEEVEALLASGAFVVDACRHVVRDAGMVVSLATRPVLFALARALGEAWPGDVPRSTLVARAFWAKHADESHRARLRVEVGRLRVELRTLADVNATKRGFALAVGLDGAKNRSCLGIDLIDLPVPILPYPERPFGPRESRVTAAAWRRDRREHSAGLRIDLLDAILGDLKQVLSVEGRSCVRGDINRAHCLATRRIEGVQLFSRSKPDVLTVKGDSMHVADTRKRSIFAEDFSCRSFHASILVTW